jgi:hypothetical protein
MSQPILKNPGPQTVIVADNGEEFPSDVYDKSGKATGSQQEVADMWAEGCLPTHSTAGKRVKLYTSTGNFKGYQYPDGRGLLKHYKHIQAIRTYSGLIIGDSSCYGRGMAHCNYPKNGDGKIDLTTLKANLKDEDELIYDITEVGDGEVTFESDRTFDLGEMEWTEGSRMEGGDPLGR